MADMKGTISLLGKGATRGEHSMPQSADLRNTMGKQLNEAYAKEAQDTQTGVTLESTNSIDKSEAVEVKNAATTGEAGNAGDPKTGDESTSEKAPAAPLAMFEKDGVFWHETTWKEAFGYFPEGTVLDGVGQTEDEEENEGEDPENDSTNEFRPMWSIQVKHTPLEWLTFYIDRAWPVYADGTLANPLDMPHLSLGFLNELHKIFPVKLSGGEVDLLAGTFWTEEAETFLEVATHADDKEVCHVVLLDRWSRLADWEQVSQQRAKAAYQSGAIFFRSMPEKIVAGTLLSGVDIYVFPADFCQEIQQLLSSLAKSRRKIFQRSGKIMQMEKKFGLRGEVGASADSTAEKGATPPVKN